MSEEESKEEVSNGYAPVDNSNMSTTEKDVLAIEEKRNAHGKEQTIQDDCIKENIVKEDFVAEGMTCTSCEAIIKRQAMKIKGVKDISVDYGTGTGCVVFDANKTDPDTILSAINKKGYNCQTFSEYSQARSNSNWLGYFFGAIGLLIIGYFILHFVEGIQIPQISQNMGYGLLFVVGLLTGFHCVSMCGGFVVSYTAKDAQEGKKSHKSHLSYGLGKTISYTVIGAGFGLVGSIITFTPLMRGIAGILAGAFLVLFGLKMLNIVPALRKLTFKTPRFIARFVGKESSKHSSPLIIGLLNGLMIACGPLQAIYIMAAGTGSAIEGAKLLFVFGLGTLPVMLGFGYIASMISSKATHKILKASGAIVIILGLIMVNRGVTLTGTGYDFNSIVASVSAADTTGNAVLTPEGIELKDGFQEIKMTVDRYGWSPNKFVLKKGVPVKWIIDGKEINGCNNAIQVPKLGLKFDIKQGEQIIEFTPDKEGIISFSCWMGMIPGTFIVKEDINIDSAAEVQEALDAAPALPAGGSCGGSGGGCGCGGAR